LKNQIRLAQRDEKDIIVDLLNKVALHLNKKGVKQWSYPWDEKEIYEEIESKLIYILIVNNTVIGTFSIKDTDYVNVPLIKGQNNYLYRVAISPEYFGKNFGLEMVDYAIKLSRGTKKSLYLDCWAGNDKLKKFYLDAGFQLLGDVPEEDYMISVFKY